MAKHPRDQAELTIDDVVLDRVPLERLEAEITGHAGRLAAATARWLVWIGAYDRRRGWESWQAKSCAHWLNWKCGVSPRAARDHVRVARALETLPLVRERFLAGQLSYSKVRAISRVAVAENEADLVQLATDATASQIERICAAMKPNDRNEQDDAAHAETVRAVRLEHHHDGTASIIITVPVAEAKTTMATIQARADDEIDRLRCEGETNGEVIERMGGLSAVQSQTAVGLLNGTIDRTEGTTPDVVMVVDHEVLVDPEVGGECTIGGDRISPLIARRIACDSRLQIALRDATNNAIGIGSESRIVNRATRRLLMRRDRAMCRFPGCEAQHRLHAHHIIHWANGGKTELNNLILLCHHHHHSVHEGGWNITTTADGSHRFSDPSGLVHTVPVLADPTDGVPLRGIKNGSAEPLAAPNERANTSYIVDVVLTNTALRKLRSDVTS